MVPVAFGVVSALGGIGPSSGIPNQRYALSGALSTTSKVIICIVVSIYVRWASDSHLTLFLIGIDLERTPQRLARPGRSSSYAKVALCTL